MDRRQDPLKKRRGRTDSKESKERTKRFAIRVIKLVDGLRQSPSIIVLSKQIVRSATSIGANYRAACGARSSAEFTAKLQIVREESDEAMYWLELLQETEDELTAILTASLKTARSHQ